MGGIEMKERYDSYKPSGIDWIGEIPSHWKIAPLKRNLIEPLMYGANEPAESDNTDFPRYIRITDIDPNGNLKTETFKSLEPSKAKAYLLKKGDVLFARSGATVGKTYIFEENYNACFAGYLIKATCSKALHPKFLYNYTLSGEYENWKNSIFIQATIQNIGADKYSLLPIPVPPLSEQEAIATWLDEKCGEIDTAIAKVDREIELIDELKQSEISRVVTRGLNPDAPLRPSGIDWIGDVPEHWTKSRIKHHICRSAAGVWGEDEKGNEDDVVCFRIADFNYGERRLGFDKITLRNIDAKQLEGRLLSEGDLLIEKSGGGDATPVGRVVYCNYSGKATCTNFIHSITLKKVVDSRFFLFYFNMLYSNKINLLFFNQTTGLQNLQVGDYLAQSLYLPPLSEQEAIADYLDKKCVEIDELKEKLVKKRETLKELRQAIISEVVTGKRKVI